VTDTYDQVPFSAVEFAENPEPRCACVLLVDTSGSMSGEPIRELNDGLAQFLEELRSDAMALKRVELAVVTFGPVRVELEFQAADAFGPLHLGITGDTPMGAAITQGLEMLRQRKDVYRQNGISYYRPWVFLLTDGAPTDPWQRAASLVHEGEAAKAFNFFAIGVRGANMEILRQIAPASRPPMMLQGLRFREFFVWLSNSLGARSRSSTDTQLALPSPSGWAVVS
jgi:uncharacterized protein YegL